MHTKWYFISLSVLLVACTQHTGKIENVRAGKLKATRQLVVKDEKKFLLDAETSAKPPYMQLFEDTSGKRIMTFLNPHDNSICFYDYRDTSYITKIKYNREGPDAILRASGYYIKNPDSIYIYNMPKVEIALTDINGRLKKQIPLFPTIDPKWAMYYPQYLLSTSNPMYEYQGKLIIPGFSPFELPDSTFNQFHFLTSIDMQTGKQDYRHTYPEELFGPGMHWEGDLTSVIYPALTPEGKMIYSFTISHDLYLTDYNSDSYSKVYAGSNIARDIPSLGQDPNSAPNELLYTHFIHGDRYGAIHYDPYRHLYYRFLEQGIPDGTPSTLLNKKPVIVILFDSHFNYLGETLIGTGEEWNWKNSFVTKEGLNIEYTGEENNEDYLILKIFAVDDLS